MTNAEKKAAKKAEAKLKRQAKAEEKAALKVSEDALANEGQAGPGENPPAPTEPETPQEEPKSNSKGFSTRDNAVVKRLCENGFHVASQTPVDGSMLWTFKETEAQIKREG